MGSAVIPEADLDAMEDKVFLEKIRGTVRTISIFSPPFMFRRPVAFRARCSRGSGTPSSAHRCGPW